MSQPTLDYTALRDPSPLRRITSAVFARQNLPLMATVVVCAGLYLTAAASFDRFARLQPFLNLFGTGNAYWAIAAVGMTFVILSGGIDLSVGAVIACSTVLMAVLIRGCFPHDRPPGGDPAAAVTYTIPGIHPLLAMLVVLLVGTAFGAAQGGLIRAFNVPPFLITLAGLFLARGVGLVTSDRPVPISHPFFDRYLTDAGVTVGHTARGAAIELSLQGIVLLVVVAAGFVLARFTRFGRTTYAVGGNEQSATLMGLPVGPTKVGVYAISGFCAALGGIMFTIDSHNGNANVAQGQELNVIAAVVVGGTVLTGGSGSVLGTLFGFLTFAILSMALDFQASLPPAWKRISVGLLLLGFILLQKLMQRRRKA